MLGRFACSENFKHKSQALRDPGFARTRHKSRGTLADLHPYHSHHRVPAHVNPSRGETCDRATRNSSYLRTVSRLRPAFLWSLNPSDSSVHREPKNSVDYRAYAPSPVWIFHRPIEHGYVCRCHRLRTGTPRRACVATLTHLAGNL